MNGGPITARRWRFTRKQYLDYTATLVAERDALRAHADYLRTRMMVAVSFLTPEQYDTFAKHVEGIDEKHRAEGGNQ